MRRPCRGQQHPDSATRHSRRGHRHRHLPAWVVVLATSVLLAVLAGCSTETVTGPTPGPGSHPRTSPLPDATSASTPAPAPAPTPTPTPALALTPAPTSAPASAATNHVPVVTVAPDLAANVLGDPAIVAFRRYVDVLVPALRSPDGTHDELFALTTGTATESLHRQIQEFRDNGWRLSGASRRVVVDVRTIDDTHHHVLSCEHDLASYPVDRSGLPARPADDRWIPDEHWFVLTESGWKLQELYRGTHDCQQIGQESE